MYKVGCDKAVFLLDRMVTPIVAYGAELWGFEYSKNIEAVQIQFCKRLLCVQMASPNSAVLGELGRYPLKVVYFTKCINIGLKY
jgi:hypothetical protein